MGEEEAKPGIFSISLEEDLLFLILKDSFSVIFEYDRQAVMDNFRGDGNAADAIAISEGVVKEIVKYLLDHGIGIDFEILCHKMDRNCPEELVTGTGHQYG